MTAATRPRLVLALLGLLGACSADGAGSAVETTTGAVTPTTVAGPTSTTIAATPTSTTTTTTTPATTTSTLPPDPWTRIVPDGLSISVALDAALGAGLSRVGDELFLTGADAAGAPSVAYSNDGGASWHQQAVGSGRPNVFVAPEGPVLLFGERGADQIFRTSRWDRQADGSWALTAAEVPGLTSDQQVFPGRTIYRHEELRPIAMLQDGSMVGFGSGGYAAPFDTGDRTPFIAQSLNGQEWTVTPMTSKTLDPLELLAGPVGPLLLAYDGVGADKTLRIQRPVDEGEVLYSQTVGEGVIAILPLGGERGYQVLLTEQRDGNAVKSLLRSPDGVTWDLQEITFDGITDVSIRTIAGNGDSVSMVVTAIPPSGGADHYPMLVAGRPGAWSVEVVEALLHTSPFGMVQLADGSLVVLTSDSDAPIIARRTPVTDD